MLLLAVFSGGKELIKAVFPLETLYLSAEIFDCQNTKNIYTRKYTQCFSIFIPRRRQFFELCT